MSFSAPSPAISIVLICELSNFSSKSIMPGTFSSSSLLTINNLVEVFILFIGKKSTPFGIITKASLPTKGFNLSNISFDIDTIIDELGNIIFLSK